jgi:hypothetical protein
MNITDGRKLSQAWKTTSTIAHDETGCLFFTHECLAIHINRKLKATNG